MINKIKKLRVILNHYGLMKKKDGNSARQVS